MEVPSKFRLGGRTWTVEQVSELHDEQGKLVWGLCHGDRCHIELRDTEDADQLEHSFWHEVMHAICFTIGYPKLNHDEDHIDAIAGMLMQVLHTKK